jgi:predicted DNA-binding antitoxin AbrB/MazE fold protein
MIIDKEINLKEGDRVDIKGVRVVASKCLNVIDDIIEYELEEFVETF